jgi:hypothetical protein
MILLRLAVDCLQNNCILLIQVVFRDDHRSNVLEEGTDGLSRFGHRAAS